MRLLLSAAIMVMPPVVDVALAQSATWNGPGSIYSDTGNWTPATVPTATATFQNNGAPTSLTGVGGSLDAFQFDSGAPAYSFTNSGGINFQAGGILNNSASTPVFNLFGGSTHNFNNNSSAGNASFNLNSGVINFNNSATAGTATITINGSGNLLNFNNTSTAGAAAINVEGGSISFNGASTAGSASFSATGGGIITFYNTAHGGTAAFNLVDADATLDFSGVTNGVNQAGSITGIGTIWLGGNTVSIGGASQSTTFGGVIADCTSDCAATPLLLPTTGGVLKKVGTGTLTLTGANTYTGGTVITGGTLQIGDGGATGSILGNITNNGTLTFNRSTAYGFVGVISGSGAVNLNGTGTVTFSAAQTYSGTTTIATGGSLALTGAGNLASSALTDNGGFDISGTTSGASITSLTGSGSVTLGSKTLTLSNPSNATFSGILSGTGGLMLSAGHEILTGASPAFTGPTTVNGGTLSVNGAISASPVTVNSGGTLGGTGTVGLTTIANGGTLSPGNSIGTLNVNGNLVFAANSIYRVEVAPAASDLTLVSGTASVNGAVQADFATGTYSPGARYAIVTSTGTLSGTFASLSTLGLPSGFSASLAYDANDAYIVLSGGDARTGLIHARMAAAYIEDERLIRDAVLDHLLTESDGVRVWGHGFAASGTVGASDPMGHNHNGAIVGVDMPLGDGFTLGVAGAWTGYKLSMPTKASSANGQAGHAVAYLGWNNLTDGSGLMLKGGGEYGWGSVNTTRQPSATETDRAHQSANTAQIFGEAAWRIHFIGADLEPHGDLFWVMGENGAFSETGGTSAMAGTGVYQDATFAKLGVRGLGRYIDLGGMKIAPSLDIGWQAALSNTAPGMTVNFLSAPGTTALLAGSPLAANAGTAQLGVKIKLGEDGELNAGYDGIFSMVGVDHAVTARLTWKF